MLLLSVVEGLVTKCTSQTEAGTAIKGQGTPRPCVKETYIVDL